ncbi:MAG: cell division regulator GpsB, partial [Streptococcaceae bacterium]|jgi:cell division septum initiation protein DivIVA|nr:cell division regulator GpsB [Streptococcaceae bacterium]
MQKEILMLQEEVQHLQAQVAKGQKDPVAKPAETQPRATVTNFDILKRLSNLEREVFGSKVDKMQKENNESAESIRPRTFVEPEVDSAATRLF